MIIIVKSIFKKECRSIMDKLMKLGNIIVNNLDNEKVEKIFLDSDFKDRTSLKIITSNSFVPLFSSIKLSILIEEIWTGKESFECDGNTNDFSLLHYLITSPARKIPGKRMKPIKLFNNNFQPSFKSQKFWYQYKYRHKSISYIFAKDFVSALGMLLLF